MNMNGLHSSVIRVPLWVTAIFWTLNGLTAREYHHRSRGRSLDPVPDMDIVGDIKRALYFDADIEEQDSFMEHAFNLRNSNPTYMFILPNKKRTKLIMKRTDFKSPIFPNVSELSVKLSRLSVKRYFEKDHLDESSDFTAFSSDESNSKNLAWENVQTEQTFIDYMERLNERADSMLSLIQERKLILHALKHSPDRVHRNQTLEWQNIGLDGWKGEIALSEGFSEETISESLPKTDLVLAKKSRKLKAKNALLPLQWNFLDNDEPGDSWDLPGKVAQDGAPNSDEVDEIFGMMINVLNDTTNVEWPIANPRAAHRNDDVYIGRANDPFGYSTKWELRSSDQSSSRNKRGISGLYSMLKCATGCDPLLLRGYGCYCGFMGAGIPADGIDRCCQAHDQCYGRTRCPMYLLYFVPYLWKCYHGQPLCAVVNGEWGSCAAQLCKCDLKLSLCTRRYRCPRRRAICWSNKFRRLQNFLRIL